MKKVELLKLIMDLQKRVDQLEKNAANKPIDRMTPIGPGLWPSQQPTINLPSIWSVPDLCIDGGQHNYPSPWMGIFPPACNKCGKQGPQYTITSTTGTSNFEV